MLKLRLRNGVYYAEGRVNGTRVRESLHTATKQDAKTKLAEMTAGIVQDGFRRVDHKLTMGDMAKDFFAHFDHLVQNGTRAARSREYYHDAWESLKRYAPGIERRKPVEVNSLDFVAKIKVQGKTIYRDGEVVGHGEASAAWYNQMIDTLRAILSRAQASGLVNKVEKFPKREKPMRRHRVGDAAELMLWPHADELLRDFIVVARGTGVRSDKEGLRIRVEHIDLAKNEVFIPRDNTKTGNGVRNVFLSERVKEVLVRRIAGRTAGWLWPGRNGHFKSISNKFMLARRAAGLPEDLKLYSCRHDFGTYMYQETKDPMKVMGAMGQSSFQAFQRYCMIDAAERNQELANIMNRRPTPLASVGTVTGTNQ